MTRVTVMAADGRLGLSIVAEALTRRLELTVVTTSPLRFPLSQLPTNAQIPMKVMRGDPLDLSDPHRLFRDADVLVVPIGSSARDVDFATDLHTAITLCRVSDRIREKATNVVLVGGPGLEPETKDEDRRGSIAFGARQLSEHAAVSMYSAHLNLPWTYIYPVKHLAHSMARVHSRGGSDGRGQQFALIAVNPASGYITTVVDVIEHHGVDAEWKITPSSVPTNTRAVSVGASTAARRA